MHRFWLSQARDWLPSQESMLLVFRAYRVCHSLRHLIGSPLAAMLSAMWGAASPHCFPGTAQRGSSRVPNRLRCRVFPAQSPSPDTRFGKPRRLALASVQVEANTTLAHPRAFREHLNNYVRIVTSYYLASIPACAWAWGNTNICSPTQIRIATYQGNPYVGHNNLCQTLKKPFLISLKSAPKL